ncbi:FliM/FliN family flagellar motor switch protein [Aestuariivirga sp.]|uniref:FliM/FliN family flagellar motor switch protein n=1 Tax=Aestuariivirga sp. TaxID=2650926 RepID=UPI003016428D
MSEDTLPAGEQERRLLRFESESGSLTASLIIDRQAISALLEGALGGTGTEPAFPMNDRPLSKIEKGVLRLAQEALANHIAMALGEALLRPFSLFEGVEAPDLDAEEGFAQFRFVLNVFSYSGEIILLFARKELERQIKAAGEENALEEASNHKQMLQSEVGKSEVSLTVTLGSEMLALDAIVGMRPGKLIALRTTASAPVTVWSGGIAAYDATLGRSGNNFAITIISAKS